MKLLKFLSTTSKPFALLLPTYIATKSYWKEFLSSITISTNQSNSIHNTRQVLYILPPNSYEYHHPVRII